MRMLILALALVATPLAALACGNSMRFERRFEASPDELLAGEKALDEGRWADAHAAADRFLSSGRAVPVRHAGKGRAAVSAHERRASRIAGLALFGLGRYGEATGPLALARNGKDALVEARLGEAYVRAGQPRKGRALLEPLAKEDRLPGASAWSALAKARRKGGDGAGAADADRRAIELDPVRVAKRSAGEGR